jgi:hypothetical protein
MKPYIIELLCLANYSYRNPEFNLQLKLKKVVLSSDTKYVDYIMENSGNIPRNQPFFYDLRAISLNYEFTMKQYPNIKNTVKSCIEQYKTLMLSQKKLHQIQLANVIKDFQMTVFYYFEESQVGESEVMVVNGPQISSNIEFNETTFKKVNPANVHNLLILRNSKPVIVMFNPFVHRIQR